MAIINNPPGTPLPDNHPFKGGRIIFGLKRPMSSEKPATKELCEQDTANLNRSEAEPLEKYFPTLIKNRRVKQALRQEFGADTQRVMVALIEGQATVEARIAQELIADLVLNSSSIKRTFHGLGDSGVFPIQINQFGPIFWISAMEFENVGYFLSLDEACAYAESEWEPSISALRDSPDESEDD